jgi:probable F420-dependent oxidoreductase
MRLGYFSLNTDGGMPPAVLARELEDRGFDSIWLPEHSHIPVVHGPVPVGEHVPDGYVHLMDPFVSLATAAMATTSLVLGTGVSMVLEHDLLDLACRVATLDVLSDGRVRFGIGAGWLAEELAYHRPDVPFASRYSALFERVRALHVIWTENEPEFHGRWEQFERSRVFPKPKQSPLPIGFGLSGSLGMRAAAELADEWYPIDVALAQHGGVAAAIAKFRDLVSAAGRDPEALPITLFVWGWEPGQPSPSLVASYAELGIERCVILPPSQARHPASATLRRLDEFAGLISIAA